MMDSDNSGVPTLPVDDPLEVVAMNEHNNIPYNDNDDGEEGSMGVVVAPDRATLLETRRTWALLHFYALRPAFSVSLILYLASLTSGRGALTFRAGVLHPIQHLATLVQMESQAYTNCVQQSANRSLQRLQDRAAHDRDRAKTLLESHQERLARAQAAATGCLQDTQKARETLMQWRTDGMDIPWTSIADGTESTAMENASRTSSCTATKRNQTEGLLGHDYRASESQWNNTLQTFMSESHNSLKTVSDYALERFEYDWNYFIGQRIEPALEFLTGHSLTLQTLNLEFSYNLTALEEMIHQQVAAMQHVLEDASAHMELLHTKLDEFRGSIHGLYVNYNELYRRMVRAAQTVSEFLPPGVPLPAVFDLSDLALGDAFLPPTGLTWPELDTELADIPQLSQEMANAVLNLVVQMLDDAQVQSLKGLRESLQELAQPLVEILELKDYRPPQFQGSHEGIVDIGHEIEFQSQRGQETLNWTAQAMIELRPQSSVFENLRMDTIEVPTVVGKFDYNYTKETSTTFELLDILTPEFAFVEYILSKIVWLGNYSFLLDILFGFIQWWKLSSMYEIGAMPNMPQIDYGAGDQRASDRPRANGKVLFFIAKSFLNPVFVGFLCVSSFFASLVIIFWIPHVQQWCVHSTNGTWFANNMLGPMLSNIAMTEGNTQYLLAEQLCYSSQNQLCSRIHVDIETQLLTDKTALENVQAQHSRSLEDLELMAMCVDSSNMTAMMMESCCGLKGYSTVGCDHSSNLTCPIDFSTSPPSAFRPLATYLESSSCSENLHEWTLNDEQYECTSLNEASHHIHCSGVNEEWIQRISNETDCKVELWIIHCCQFWAVAVIQFVSLYIICSLIYFGCRDFHWRKISPDSIGLRTHLLENGVLAKGANLDERSRRISNEIKWFEHKARIQVFLGALLLLVYIVVVLMLCLKR